MTRLVGLALLVAMLSGCACLKLVQPENRPLYGQQCIDDAGRAALLTVQGLAR